MPRYFIKLFSQSVMERNQVLPVAVAQQGEWICYLCLYLDQKKNGFGADAAIAWNLSSALFCGGASRKLILHTAEEAGQG